MSTKWSTQVIGKTGTPNFGELLKDEYTVILLRGKNTFGDMIYCYVKLTFPDLHRLEEALKYEDSFNPSDFGTVVAAGRGEPTDEVKMEVAATYPVLGKAPAPAPKPAAAAIPEEKKAWDEY